MLASSCFFSWLKTLLIVLGVNSLGVPELDPLGVPLLDEFLELFLELLADDPLDPILLEFPLLPCFSISFAHTSGLGFQSSEGNVGQSLYPWPSLEQRAHSKALGVFPADPCLPPLPGD